MKTKTIRPIGLWAVIFTLLLVVAVLAIASASRSESASAPAASMRCKTMRDSRRSHYGTDTRLG